jgi:pectinesterase
MQHTMKLFLMFGAALLQSAAISHAALKVTVANPSAYGRQSETIELQWHTLVDRNPGLTPANVAVFHAQTRIPCQLVDADADGAPDVLVFQVDLRPHERMILFIRPIKEHRDFPFLVDARFELPREDVAWESDRIAFRIYGPALAADVNDGIDVWVKRVRSLVVDKWYTASAEQKKDTYHEDHGEGADFFSVGRTLGAGGCAVAKGATLYQPGVFTTQRILAGGPVRALFTVTYDKGAIDGMPFKVVKTYSIDAGHNLNRIVVRFTGIGANDSLRFVAGLVKRKNAVPLYDSAACWLSLWGAVNDDPVNEQLGTGIVLPPDGFEGMREDKDHYMLSSKIHDGSPITYYSGAGWTRSGDFTSAAEWAKLLGAWSLRLRAPVNVVLEPVK